jgi:succinate dehydrogenase/fumarate reductase flavoprotein subunit
MNVEWDKEADVVVVGFGGAGAAAAVTAHDLGASVLMLEKAPEGEEGGNTRVAGQGYLQIYDMTRR